MQPTQRTLPTKKNIALIAHDHCKTNLLDWCKNNAALLSNQHLFATGTTGLLIKKNIGLAVTCLLSGPMGGDQQIGALIAEKKLIG